MNLVQSALVWAATWAGMQAATRTTTMARARKFLFIIIVVEFKFGLAKMRVRRRRRRGVLKNEVKQVRKMLELRIESFLF